MILPHQLAGVLLPLAPAFTAPTFDRFALLTLSALLTTGRSAGSRRSTRRHGWQARVRPDQRAEERARW